jgi:phage baseplate assembly protein W
MEHDIIYKKPVLKGFGGKLFEAIEQRLQKIMKAHLLPAGYEFQKALDDYERRCRLLKAEIQVRLLCYRQGKECNVQLETKAE